MPDALLNSKPMQYAAAAAVFLLAAAIILMWCYVIITGHGDVTQPGDIVTGLVFGGGVVGGGYGVHVLHTKANSAAGQAQP